MAAVELLDEVRGPVPGDLEARRDSYWRFLERLFLGAIRFRRRAITALGIPLIRMGEPSFREGAWHWAIEGGLLARRPGGELGFGAEDAHLVGFLRGYHPLLPEPLYSLTQQPVHRLITRLFLLDLRGRRHPPGVPAEPGLRLAAAAIDGLLLLGATRVLPRRVRPVAAFGYFAGAWALGGRTVGQRLLGMRVVASDGSPVTPGQAVLRALVSPAVPVVRRAVHDEVAGTEVVRER